MNATPAFDPTKDEYVRGLAVGTRVRANWGAGWPTTEGTIVEENDGTLYTIEWDDDHSRGRHRVRAMRTVNGSPIGVWLV